MEKDMVNKALYYFCCKCGHPAGRAEPGSKWSMTCPKCGSQLEVRVEGMAVHVAVRKMKEPRVAAAAR